ncbi:hypothetical protein RFI_05709 [Reticulomyxa filosa]|uniref:Uncharacterized protein n=1 Tax=Reticulomyxa filosa TaxID=46433 RepID=X6NZN5_RETFI|nr:hypothetical protein RFI_05709 [Reticulomyxa filosa]|eukprot:ETO31411.1 hypothetical protein RFI_05709 [Reticulomyxa filosa]
MASSGTPNSLQAKVWDGNRGRSLRGVSEFQRASMSSPTFLTPNSRSYSMVLIKPGRNRGSPFPLLDEAKETSPQDFAKVQSNFIADEKHEQDDDKNTNIHLNTNTNLNKKYAKIQTHLSLPALSPLNPLTPSLDHSNVDIIETKEEQEEQQEQQEQEKAREKTTLQINYSSIKIDTRQQCHCGYILSDAQVMANWPEDFLSTEINCNACNLNTLVPKIHIQCMATETSTEKQVPLDFNVTYLSPLYLRRSMEIIVSKFRQRLEDCENLRLHHPDEYWNLLWYFAQRKLDYNWLLQESDWNKLRITPIIDSGLTKYPLDDEELGKQMRIILGHIKTKNLKLAMIQWLKNRENTSTKERDQSIWDISLYDAFFNLDVPLLYQKYEDYVNEFRQICSIIQPVIGDCPPEKKVVKYEIIFKHIRPLFPRLHQYRIQNNQS